MSNFEKADAISDSGQVKSDVPTKKIRSWQAKAALSAGVGVPLGLLAMADPAAATPEFDDVGFSLELGFDASANQHDAPWTDEVSSDYGVQIGDSNLAEAEVSDETIAAFDAAWSKPLAAPVEPAEQLNYVAIDGSEQPFKLYPEAKFATTPTIPERYPARERVDAGPITIVYNHPNGNRKTSNELNLWEKVHVAADVLVNSSFSAAHASEVVTREDQVDHLDPVVLDPAALQNAVGAQNHAIVGLGYAGLGTGSLLAIKPSLSSPNVHPLAKGGMLMLPAAMYLLAGNQALKAYDHVAGEPHPWHRF